jgi:predicted cation transporter
MIEYTLQLLVKAILYIITLSSVAALQIQNNNITPITSWYYIQLITKKIYPLNCCSDSLRCEKSVPK